MSQPANAEDRHDQQFPEREPRSYLYQARIWVNCAVSELVALRRLYDEDRLLPPLVRSARLLMIDSKITALRAVVLNPDAHPWASDWNTETPPTEPVS